MKTLERDGRSRRAATLNLEYLDERIVPSTMHVAAGASAEVVAAVSVAQRHENPLAVVETRHEKHVIAVAHHQAVLELRHEKAVARRDVRLARQEAVFVANHPNAIKPTPNPIAAGTLPANVSNQLQSLYTQYESYESSGGSGTFSPTGITDVVISGTNVGILVKDNNTGDFNTLNTELQTDGMQILDSDATYGLIDGMLPIAQLPTIAQLPQTVSVTPMIEAMPQL